MTQSRTKKGVGKHRVVSHKAWIEARRKFLAKEKKFTGLRDELARQRRALPWEKVEKQYVFDGPKGGETLAELFDGRSQLVVYHFMFAPDWNEGCKHCSFWADNFNGLGIHLNHRDVSFIAISRAPLAKLDAFKKRMGWSFKWVSSGRNDFNYDYQASFTPQEVESGAAFFNYSKSDVGVTDREGVSVFYKEEGSAVFHTYSSYARGIDILNTAYHYLDLVPKGRDEDALEFTQSWVRFHDRYEL
ncbi:MAG TPA: thioredoxin family protein [Burkholderiales bacterium]|nr:thioredoxin family protein [Burkholderiales bacterium]